MRVLFVSSHFHPAKEWGGVVSATWSLAQGLAQNGVDIHVVTSKAKMRGLAQVDNDRRENGVEIHAYKPLGGGRIGPANRWAIALGAFRHLFEQGGRFDLVHLHGIWGPLQLTAGVQAMVRKIPFVISPHGSLEHSARSRKKLRKAVAQKTYSKILIENAAALQFNSQTELERSMDAVGRADAFWLPNAISVPPVGDRASFRTRIGAKGSDVVLGMFGRLHEIKGFDVILPALAELPDGAQIILAIAGQNEGGYLQSIEGMAREYGVAKKLRILGLLDPAQLADAYSGVDFLVAPSHKESFGLTVAEAVAAGTPVIVSDRVGISDWVTANDAGIVVPHGVDGWATTLSSLTGSSKERWDSKTLQEKAVEAFSPKSVARRLLLRYESFVERRSSEHI